MSKYGFGQFHVYAVVDGQERVRKAYRTFDEADQARNFLESLGYTVEIEMNSKSRDWEPPEK